jgi:drug/metabolite transporter (DMT)-like permease
MPWLGRTRGHGLVRFHARENAIEGNHARHDREPPEESLAPTLDESARAEAAGGCARAAGVTVGVPEPPHGRRAAVWPGTDLPLRGFVLLVLLSLFWGFNWPLMKIGMEAIPVFPFRAISFVIGSLTLLGLCRLFGYSLRVPRAHWPALVLVAILMTTFQLLSGYGVIMIGSGRAAVMGYTMPVWSVLLGTLVLKERLTWRPIVSLALGIGGMAVLLSDEYRAIGGAPLGMLLMAITAIAWSISTVIHKKVAWGAPTIVLVAWQMTLASIPMCIGALFVDYSAVPFPGLWPILALVYNTAIGQLFCIYAYFETVRLFPVSVATIGVLMVPVIGVLSGAIVLGEPLGWVEFSALGLVVCALALPVMTRRRG